MSDLTELRKFQLAWDNVEHYVETVQNEHEWFNNMRFQPGMAEHVAQHLKENFNYLDSCENAFNDHQELKENLIIGGVKGIDKITELRCKNIINCVTFIKESIVLLNYSKDNPEMAKSVSVNIDTLRETFMTVSKELDKIGQLEINISNFNNINNAKNNLVELRPKLFGH